MHTTMPHLLIVPIILQARSLSNDTRLLLLLLRLLHESLEVWRELWVLLGGGGSGAGRGLRLMQVRDRSGPCGSRARGLRVKVNRQSSRV